MTRHSLLLAVVIVLTFGSSALAQVIRPLTIKNVGNVPGGAGTPTIASLIPGTLTLQPADAWAPVRGLYRGFAPTDESAVGYGELKVVVGKKVIRLAHATGLKVLRETIPLGELEPIAQDQFSPEFIQSGSVQGFRNPSNNMSLIFHRDHVTKVVSGIIAGSLGDLLGPTFFLGTDPVSENTRAEAAKIIERGMPGSIPLLSSGGQTPRR